MNVDVRRESVPDSIPFQTPVAHAIALKPATTLTRVTPPKRRARVLILGAGFAGLSVARKLAGRDIDVTLVDRENHHLFQPLLYQVAMAEISPGDIAWPIRTIVRGGENIRVVLGEVSDIDTSERHATVADQRIDFDYLVVATGVTHAYFGNDTWADNAPGLKTIDDATEIRRRVLLAFEKAESSRDDEEIDALLTFVVVGGGATGVELAGALAELARDAMRRDFRHIDPARTRVMLVEASRRVLPTFDETLSEYARQALEDMGVEVHLRSPITECEENGVVINGELIPAGTVLWAAGVRAEGPAAWLDADSDSAGRIVVGPNLTIPGQEHVFVVGDCASVTNSDGKPVPGVAPAAKQQGQYVGDLILSRLKTSPQDDQPEMSFTYRNSGNLATIGKHRAVADFGWIKLRGRLAWWLWGVAHIYFLIGARNRLLVALNWMFSYLTDRRGVRLITGSAPNLD